MNIRDAKKEDRAGAYYVCMKTGDFGKDGEAFYRDDPDALGRIFVGPYLEFEPELSLVLEDAEGICGYAFGALDSRDFYRQYEMEWRPRLVRDFPEGKESREGSRVAMVHSWYHHPDYFCPEPYEKYPSHLHIDLLPRAQGRGFGRQMMEEVMRRLKARGSVGTHLGVSEVNTPAIGFYEKLGFRELVRNEGVIYMGKEL
jgi:ribosomal protein S18 acetylase RimI-like enzyme